VQWRDRRLTARWQVRKRGWDYWHIHRPSLRVVEVRTAGQAVVMNTRVTVTWARSMFDRVPAGGATAGTGLLSRPTITHAISRRHAQHLHRELDLWTIHAFDGTVRHSVVDSLTFCSISGRAATTLHIKHVHSHLTCTYVCIRQRKVSLCKRTCNRILVQND
jgi:hypothetical protein